MSRIGKKPIPVLDKVKVAIKDGQAVIDGPKGKLVQAIPSSITVDVRDGNIIVGRNTDTKIDKSLHGLIRALLANMIQGVTEGYTKELEIIGVGYRAQMEGKNLVMQLGFSHPVKYEPIDDVALEVIPKQNRVIIRGLDKAKVGQAAAEIRRIKRPEPYKGAGIRYVGEHVRRKLGKAAGTK
ncbi:MAG TPA: 50S ribosomal protein L6 [Candidatus Omnitrophica bacterium]|nr:50S ribosomal protein L6 [Candidatus Omnitrophota bacterium]